MGLWDDIVYVAILVVSLFLALVIKYTVGPGRRRSVVVCAFGIIIVSVVCGFQILYSLGLVVGNLILIKFVNCRQLHICSFVYTFAFLTFTRCAHLIGLPKLLPHANAVQLIITLRCVGLAMEIHDSKKSASLSKKNDGTPIVRRTIVVPNISQAFQYLYSFAGIFTGPYYTYRTHCDMLHISHLWQIKIASEIVPRLCIAPFYCSLFWIVDTLFPLSYMRSFDFFENNGILVIFLYMCPVFLALRLRCYVAWTLAEAVCITNGIGAYPSNLRQKCGQGLVDISQFQHSDVEDDVINEEYSFETITNIIPYGCEFAMTFRDGMRCWNRSVQYWLANCVYRRFPTFPTIIRTGLTLFVSAFWHGIHPGYFMAFLTIPLCLIAEDRIRNHVHNNTFFSFIWWFITRRGLEQMATGFLLLTFTGTLLYWNSIYWFIHVVMIITIIVSYTQS